MRKAVFIAGGGTGGHIYPAMAIAHSLRTMAPDLQIHFVGSRGGLESKIIPEHGFPLHLVPIGKLNHNVSLAERLKTLVSLPISFLVSLFLLLKYRPLIIVGVGGFVSAPILFTGALLRFRTVIWEPNAFPGMANRLLVNWVGLALVVFEEAKTIFERKIRRIQIVGLPIRQEIENLRDLGAETMTSQNSFGPMKILIFGGSQGARGINNTVCEALTSGEEWLRDFDFIHQTGSLDYSSIKERYLAKGARVSVREYLPEIFKEYRWADLIVCRAGASTISELAAAGKAAVLIPFPFAADNHQQRNAEAAVNKGAAVMILQSDFSPECFRELLLKLRANPLKCTELSRNMGTLYHAHAADEIAQILIKEISGKLK